MTPSNPISGSRGSDRRYWLALIAGMACVLTSGALYGHFSQRWGPPVDLQAAAAQLKSLPKQIGSWRLTKETAMDESVVEMLECAGSVNRRYVDDQSGAVVDVAIIVGPPGPTAVHTPEICYSSRAYEIKTSASKANFVDGSPGNADTDAHALWHVTFKSKSFVEDQLSVYYGWSTGAHWEASNSPRFQYGGEPLLFKLQIAGSVGPKDASSDPAKQFLEALFNSDWKLKG